MNDEVLTPDQVTQAMAAAQQQMVQPFPQPTNIQVDRVPGGVFPEIPGCEGQPWIRFGVFTPGGVDVFFLPSSYAMLLANRITEVASGLVVAQQVPR